MDDSPFQADAPHIFSGKLSNIQRSGSFVRFTLDRPAFSHFVPGQFVKVAAWQAEDPGYQGDPPEPGHALPLRDPYLKGAMPLLARAFGISLARFASPGGAPRLIPEPGDRMVGHDLIIKAVGVGTEILRGIQPGSSIRARGPLGRRGFSWDRVTRALLVAGGAGVAPLLPLAQALRAEGIATKAFIGGKTSDDLPPGAVADFEAMGCDPEVATEDGSLGHKGRVTDLMEGLMEGAVSRISVYACGPEAMLRHVCERCNRLGVQAQVSMESKTACGVGVCLGCLVSCRRRDGHHPKVCLDGPVFSGGELEWI